MNTPRRVPYEDVERQLIRIFRKVVFDPILAVVKAGAPGVDRSIHNADDSPLRNALRTGGVQFRDGIFSGSFNAAISGSLKRMGASFDKRSGVYRLDGALVPAWVKAEAGAFQVRAADVHRGMTKRLDELERDLDSAVDAYTVDADQTVGAVEVGFKGVARELEISSTLGTEARERLAEDYSNNMKLWIKKFSAEQIQALRGVVERNADQGYRFSGLMDGIQARYGVTKTKATFLARQETALFMSKFRQERFGEAGIREYIWSTAHDERVRDRHKHLDKKRFYYSQPPVVDEASGRRGNPGEDFNCRCVDIPVLS